MTVFWEWLDLHPVRSTERLIILYIAMALNDTTVHWHLSTSYGGSSVTLRLKRNVDSLSSRYSTSVATAQHGVCVFFVLCADPRHFNC